MARKYHDKEWLENKYHNEGMTIYEIAEIVGVHNETIRNWLHRHNIDVRKRGPEKGTNYTTVETPSRETLRQQYWEKHKSVTEMAKNYGVANQTIRNWFDERDIKTRTLSEAQQGNKHATVDARLSNKQWLQKEYNEKGRSMANIARELDVTSAAVKYHLDEHGIERRNESRWNNGDTEFQKDPKWGEKRNKRLKMDEYTCQDCGIKQSEYDRSLDVHHVKPKDEFVTENGVDWGRANDPSNLESLCRSCHIKRHRS